MVKDILEDNWPLLSPFWKSCTDTTTIDTLGLTAVKPLLDEIDNYYQGVDTLFVTLLPTDDLFSCYLLVFGGAYLKISPQDLANIVASLHRSSVDIFFRFGVDVDAYNPDLTVVNFQQGGIVRLNQSTLLFV
jgi:predicted metalloendopeptidase